MSDIEWIKITTSGYRNPKLCKIREMKDGNECCLFWYLLLQRAGECNDSGRVWITEDIPYSLKDLSKTFNFSQKKIRKFLEIFSEFFMIFLDISHENICKISIINWEKYQNENKLQQIRENQKQRVARHREKLKKELEQNSNVTCNVTVTDNQPLQNRYSNTLDIRNKNIEQDIHEEEVHDEDSSDEKKSEISSSDDVGVYGQYGNVCLTKKQYQKMLGICMSQKFLDELVDSIQKQTYDNWELILSDGSGNNGLEECLKKYETDKRIKVLKNEKALDISENTNRALELVKGEYIVFADHDDLLPPHALYQCAKVIYEKESPDLIYSDEDKLSMNGTRYFQPHFKPDFNLELLRSMNYFCHLVVVKKELQQAVGMLNPEYNGAQDYDFVLRCVEQAKYIYHIPEVLYHWRSHSGSIAGGGENKEYAFEAGRKALLAHYERCGIRAEVGKDDIFGIYHTEYLLQEHPLVSIITDNSEELKNVVENGLYKEYEYVEKENVGKANGKYLLFLEEGIEKAKSGWLKKMVEDGAQNEIGVVGAKVMEKTGKQLHAGMVLGGKGMIHYVAEKSDINDVGYMGRYVCTQEYSAVSGMCMLVERQCFEAVGGFDDELTGELRYTDLCLKIRGAGYKVMYEPGAMIYIKKSIHLNLSEKQYFSKRWHNVLEQGDMYYNKNLEIEDGLYVLKKEPRN